MDSDPTPYEPMRPTAPPYEPPLFQVRTAQVVPLRPCFFCKEASQSLARLSCGCSIPVHTNCSSLHQNQVTRCPVCNTLFIPVQPLLQQVHILQQQSIERDMARRRTMFRGSFFFVCLAMGVVIWLTIRYVWHIG
jgi:hypothetical protein